MAKIVWKDTEYETPETFTPREQGILKRVAGVRMGELEASLEAGDIELFAALLFIAKKRAGEIVDEAAILDDPDFLTHFRAIKDPEPEADASPPGQGRAPNGT